MSHQLSQSDSVLEADEALFYALLRGSHAENAAKVAGVSERTVYRRLADPGFRLRLESARESLRDSILSRLSDAASDAISILRELMEESEDEKTRLQAAKALLDALLNLNASAPRVKQTLSITTEH